ncbi:MAG: caspase family protein [Rubrivivax sp.]|nr:caspase family protein [Rubrivivax sp.]
MGGLAWLSTWFGRAQAVLLISSCAAALAQEGPGPVLQVDPGGHWGPIRRVAVSPDNVLVATASDDKTVRVWVAGGATPLHTLRPPVGHGTAGRMYGAAFHPTQQLLAVAGTSARAGKVDIYLFNPRTAEFIRTIASAAGEVKRLRWSRDGRWLLAALASPGAVRVFSADGFETAALSRRGDVYGLDTNDSGLVAVTDASGAIDLFQLRPDGSLENAGALATSTGEPIAAAFAPADDRLAVVYFSRERFGMVDIFSSTQRHLLQTLRAAGVGAGSGRMQAVAWNARGATLAIGGVRTSPGASGSDAIDTLAGIVWRLDPASAKVVDETVVASDTVTDLAATPDGGWVYTSFDSSWGHLGESGAAAPRGPRNEYVRRADRLWAVANAMAVGWQTTPDAADRRSFDVVTRALRAGQLPGASRPELPGLFSGTRDWESATAAQPRILGAPIPLGVGEISRAVARIGASADVVWGSGHRLARVAPGGHMRWSVQPGAESRAVHSSADGRLVVAALADGTIRWLRADDGTLLLTLLTTPQGQWLLWTPSGYYDASPGGERLIGWLVQAIEDGRTQFHSIGRFRNLLYRPDVIDRILDTTDEREALRAADTARSEALLAAEAAATSTGAPLPASPSEPERAGAAAAPISGSTSVPTQGPLAQPRPSASSPRAEPPPLEKEIVRRRPPTLVHKSDPIVRTEASRVRIQFGIDSPHAAVASLVVRRDGVLQELLDYHPPGTFDGQSSAGVTVEVPVGASTVHLAAANEHGFSDPLTFRLERQAPSIPWEPPPPGDPIGTRPVRLFVLAVGVGTFSDPRIHPLALPGKDARDFVAVLQSQQGQAFARVESRLLIDRDATRAAVTAGLKWLTSVVGADDLGVLYLAGHGFQHPAGSYHFIAHDTRAAHPVSTSLDEALIHATLTAMRGRAVLFVDTCQASHAAGRSRGITRDMSRITNDLTSPENGVIVFASSTGRQESLEKDEWGNGAFTKALVAGLNGAADVTRRGRVTFPALGHFVTSEVDALTQGRQTPVLIAPPPGVPDLLLAHVRRMGASP